MRKYLYLIKKQKIKSWLKFWLLTNNKFNSILSNILEGTSFDLQNTVKRYFKIFNIFGNSVQDGTPSPENPVPIDSVADDVNLFDASKIANSSIVVKDNGKTIIMPLVTSGNENTITSTKLNVLCPDLQVGDVIYIRFKRNLNNNRNKFIYLYGSNRIMYAMENSPSYTITQEDLNSYVFLYGNDYDYGETQQCIITDFRIVKNINTPYSPYNYGTFTIDFEGQTENYNYTFITEPLRSLPNGVKDTIEEDGIHRKIGTYILDGTENWIIADEFENRTVIQASGLLDNKNNYYLCNRFIKDSTALNRIVLLSSPKIIYLSLDNNISQINYSQDTTQIKLQKMKTWLSNNLTEVLYELAEEIIEPYTEEQQEQYNKIKELYTFDGTTNIYSTDVVPPYLQIQYYMKGE